MRCCHCLHQSTPEDPVVMRWFWVGGKSNQIVAVCQDSVKCWERWDRAHGLTDTAAIRMVAEREVKA